MPVKLRVIKHCLNLIFTALLIVVFRQQSHGQEHHTDVTEAEHHPVKFHHKSVSFGVGIPYSLEFQAVGINSRLYYNIGEDICFGPEVSYFSKDDIDILDINFVLHYIFETSWTGIYPVVGLNYTIEKELIKFPEESEFREEAFGSIVGLGLHRNFRKWTVFSEFTIVVSELSDRFSTTGLIYTFK